MLQDVKYLLDTALKFESLLESTERWKTIGSDAREVLSHLEILEREEPPCYPPESVMNDDDFDGCSVCLRNSDKVDFFFFSFNIYVQRVHVKINKNINVFFFFLHNSLLVCLWSDFFFFF